VRESRCAFMAPTRCLEPAPPRIPRRVELHHQAASGPQFEASPDRVIFGQALTPEGPQAGEVVGCALAPNPQAARPGATKPIRSRGRARVQGACRPAEPAGRWRSTLAVFAVANMEMRRGVIIVKHCHHHAEEVGDFGHQSVSDLRGFGAALVPRLSWHMVSVRTASLLSAALVTGHVSSLRSAPKGVNVRKRLRVMTWHQFPRCCDARCRAITERTPLLAARARKPQWQSTSAAPILRA
jgi:hypothetical protein